MSTPETEAPTYAWEYLGSLVGGDESLMIGGHYMTPEPVDALPEEPELGMLLAVLQDPDTGLRWVLLFH